MAQHNPLDVVICGDNKQYYSYNEELYHKTFPYEWAEMDIQTGKGPQNCKYCQKYGFWNGVFVAYCQQCANWYAEQGLTRGNGLCGYICAGISLTDIDDPMAECNTYLKETTLDDIGDKDFVDSLAVYKAKIKYDGESDPFYYRFSKIISGSDTLRSIAEKTQILDEVFELEEESHKSENIRKQWLELKAVLEYNIEYIICDLEFVTSHLNLLQKEIKEKMDSIPEIKEEEKEEKEITCEYYIDRTPSQI